MKQVTILFFLLILLCPNFVQAQYWGAQEIDTSKLNSWEVTSIEEYAGIYNFGTSESETDVLFIDVEDTMIVQVRNGYWEEGTGFWKEKFLNLSNVSVSTEGVFSSENYSGQFVIYTLPSGEKVKGLKVEKSWIPWALECKSEFGSKDTQKFSEYFYGLYPEASFRNISVESLRHRNLEELSLMRNEIFARYGYQFKSGGKMDKYFKKQAWYRPTHKNVNDFITPIEERNIQMIQSFEKLLKK